MKNILRFSVKLCIYEIYMYENIYVPEEDALISLFLKKF